MANIPTAGDTPQAPLDWEQWYLSVLDGLIDVISGANIEWGTRSDGSLCVIAGDTTSSGMDYPACFIPRLSKTRSAESTRWEEWHTLESELFVIDRGDPQAHQILLRDGIAQMAKVENSLYANRTLNGSAKFLRVTETTPIEAIIESESLRISEITLEVSKKAEHEY